jgi:hypothetical protein
MELVFSFMRTGREAKGKIYVIPLWKLNLEINICKSSSCLFFSLETEENVEKNVNNFL